jgi:hypothetical protein
MRTIATGSGFRLSDNRTSGGAKEENDVLTCPHCQAVINLQAWRKADHNQHGYCAKCQAPVCHAGPCAQDYAMNGCRPFIQKIERMLSNDHALMQFRKLAGLLPAPPASFKRYGV